MAVVNTHDFWKLLLKSNLLPKERCQQLHESFKQHAGGDADSKKLAKWLIGESAITPYQARVLLGGKSGPFQLGAYRLIDRVDSGPLAGAYHAEHIESGHPVLLHKVPKMTIADAPLWAVVQQQIRSRCATPHPHLWRCFELFEIGGNNFFLATEEPTGNPLQESRPGPGQPVPAADCARLVRQATLAIDRLHSMGIIQGNLTPDALWLEANGNLKVMNNPLDLPQAADWSKADEATLRRADYSAPELATPGTPPTRLSDVYSLGCILFDLLTGNPPFAGGDLNQKFSRHAAEPVAQAPQIPPQMFQTLAYMMAKSPTVRYQTAGDVANALGALVDPSQLNPPVVTAPATLGAYMQSLPQVTPPPSATPPQGMPQHFSPPTAAPFPGAPGMPMPGAPGMPMPGAPPMMPGYGAPPMATPVATPVAAPVAAPVATPVGAPVAAAAVPGAIQGESRATSLAERARKKKQVKRITQLVVLAILAIGMGGAGIWVLQNMPGENGDVADNDPTPVTVDPSNPPTIPGGGGNTNPPPTPQTGGEMPVQLIADDQQTLWASPTQGAAITLEGLPSGVKSVLTLRVDDLTGSEAGRKALEALGPQFNAAWKGWETTSGFSWSEVETATFGYGPTTPAAQPTIVVRLKGPTNLMSKWGGAQSVGQAPSQYFKLGAWSFYPLPTESGRGFAMGADSDIAAIAATGGAAPTLPLEMEQLRRSSDDERTLNLLFDARYLQSPQSPLSSGALAGLKEPVGWFLGDMIQAGLVSCQLDATNCYTEGRFIGSLAAEPFGLAESLRARILGGSKLVANTIAQLGPTPYWQSLGGKFPTMLEFAHKFARTGADGKQAVINIALPSYAAPNLLAAAELTISASTSGSGAAGPTAVAGGGGGANDQSVEGKLKKKISLAFPQNSLDFAMRDFGDELGAPVKLLGGDLQLDGITQNQQIRQFNMMDQPAEEVLIALLMKANPVTTVTAPNEADQKLVYVIAPDPENPDGDKVILITTRAQAAKKKYELPAPFQLKK
ncbi:protein kinase [Blastopirellula sp. JC732]|uniref:Protein kinase n=1 Tax=Blastopirellula sediminis TaxID=2894196 RepID=A0A9X1SI33_9BACT|nr:protein kinase [Blastopirellula sediminis]MCC9604831.1 protein kinase [Blastopirellula sediminis]MCC9631870.1 protein kinase [Blastopirellula sediminis]